MLFDQTYHPMARRRLKIFTICLLLLIVFLTVIARMFDEEKPNKLPKRFYVSPSKKSTPAPATSMELHLHYSTEGKQLRNSSADSNSYVPDNLTRYGANLVFNPATHCPKDSLMRSNWKSLKPKTHRCPQVFIIGAKKGGTTSLYQYLSKHPDFQGIRLNESKWIGETFYFAQKYYSQRLSEYIHLFPKDKMTGDASVDNLLFCKSPERILKTCGFKTKIIVLLRHPIQRYISNFMMRVDRPVYTAYDNYTSISETTKSEYDILKGKQDQKGLHLPPQNRSDWLSYNCLFSCCSSMIYEGMYYVFVMNWLCNFPKENMLFLNSEEMFEYPVKIYQEVLTFLGLKPLVEAEIKHITSTVYNKGPKPDRPQHQMKEDDIRTLNGIYKHFNEGLLDLLNWSTLDWS